MFALASIPAWRHFARKMEEPPDRPFLNRRAEGYVGREFTLDKPIVNGVGTIHIDDTVWRVSGPDCPAGIRPFSAKRTCATNCAPRIRPEKPASGLSTLALRAAPSGHDNDQGGRRRWIRADAPY